MLFRDRLFATIAAARAVLEEPGVLVVGSEVPNLLEPNAAATLVVSQDLDIGIPVDRHAAVKLRLTELREFQQSLDEPSVWTPRSPELLEVNFVGIDRTGEKGERDLLVALGLLLLMAAGDLDELAEAYRRLRPELRHAVCSNLTLLSLLGPRAGLPDPRLRRVEVAALLRRLDCQEAS